MPGPNPKTNKMGKGEFGLWDVSKILLGRENMELSTMLKVNIVKERF